MWILVPGNLKSKHFNKYLFVVVVVLHVNFFLRKIWVFLLWYQKKLTSHLFYWKEINTLIIYFPTNGVLQGRNSVLLWVLFEPPLHLHLSAHTGILASN